MAHIDAPGGKPLYLINGIRDGLVICEKWNGSRFNDHVEIPIGEVDLDQLQVSHYYGRYEIKISGVWQLVRTRTLFVPYFRIAVRRILNGLSQSAFNARKLITKERMAYLRAAQHLTLTRGKFSLQDLMVEMHGVRWFFHPDRSEHRQKTLHLLELLVDGGDLKKDDSICYRLSGKALESIAVFEEEERRNRVAQKWQWLVGVIGLATVFFTAAQTGLIKLPTLINWSGPPPNSQAHKD